MSRSASTVSIAFLKSMKRSGFMSCLLWFSFNVDRTSCSADSQVRPLLKPCWPSKKSELFSKYADICFAIIFSNNLAIAEITEIPRELFKSSLSPFLKRGVTTAHFHSIGIVLEVILSLNSLDKKLQVWI